jgi:hypothetical protein
MNASLLLVLGLALISGEVKIDFASGVDILVAVTLALAVIAMAVPGGQERRIKALKQHDHTGERAVFALELGDEKVTLDPGKAWIKVDQYKWVTRGLMEPPQSFHIQPNGTVEINGEKITLDDPEGIAKLEYEINKRRTVPIVSKTTAAPATGVQTNRPAAAQAQRKVQFKVRIDHLGHMMIECKRGAEQVETGLRGFHSMIQSGFILSPQSLHIDPLQRAIEIDGIRYECSEAGARQLEETLNSKYAPTLKAEGEDTIEIKENPASATGFDIQFATVQAGFRLEVKGHLSQEKLDLLQDPLRCDLLQRDVALRLSPPHLLIRRKRIDGGEERIPEIPDVHYRRISALELERIFNHPLIRRSTGHNIPATTHPTGYTDPDLIELRLVRNPQNNLQLVIECITNARVAPEPIVFTHHNLANLARRGVFQPHLEVTLSLDDQRLTVLDRETGQADTLVLNSPITEEALARASRMLTAALKSPATQPTERQPASVHSSTPAPAADQRDSKPPAPPSEVEPSQVLAPATALAEPSASTRNETAPASHDAECVADRPAPPTAPEEAAAAGTVSPPTQTQETSRDPVPSIIEPQPQPAQSESSPDEALLVAFAETDPIRINIEVFRGLSARLGLTAQEVRLSLPRVFENRRFEVISFSHAEIVSVLELRSEDFFGFYLSHVNNHNILLVYGCKGKHIEWGAGRCLLEASVSAEPNEFRGSGLLGMAQDTNDHFVFVVRPEFKQWVAPHEKQYEEIYAHFVTPRDLAAHRAEYVLIWPELPAQPST